MAILDGRRRAGLEEGDDGEKWVKYYCSKHEILLVGDGDFSFSLSLAMSFGSAYYIVATSLDSYHDLIKKYKNAKSNLEKLKSLGASILLGVDATKMKYHMDLFMRKFDRIIFNFPHAGFYGREDNALMIQMHKRLVFGFFKNASQMLRPNGEIHMNHKTNVPFCNWDIVQLAEQTSLALMGFADFKKEDYPGYINKRGDGHRCDAPFPLGECSTFIFCFNHRVKKAPRVLMNAMRRTQLPLVIPISNQYHQTSFEPNHSQVTHFINSRHHQPPPIVCCMIPKSAFDRVSLNTAQVYARNPAIEFPANTVRVMHGRFMAEIPERTLNGDLYVSHEHHRLRSMIEQRRFSYYGERTDANSTSELFRYW